MHCGGSDAIGQETRSAYGVLHILGLVSIVITCSPRTRIRRLLILLGYRNLASQRWSSRTAHGVREVLSLDRTRPQSKRLPWSCRCFRPPGRSGMQSRRRGDAIDLWRPGRTGPVRAGCLFFFSAFAPSQALSGKIRGNRLQASPI
jgi:hypothetical protein